MILRLPDRARKNEKPQEQRVQAYIITVIPVTRDFFVVCDRGEHFFMLLFTLITERTTGDRCVVVGGAVDWNFRRWFLEFWILLCCVFWLSFAIYAPLPAAPSFVFSPRPTVLPFFLPVFFCFCFFLETWEHFTLGKTKDEVFFIFWYYSNYVLLYQYRILYLFLASFSTFSFYFLFFGGIFLFLEAFAKFGTMENQEWEFHSFIFGEDPLPSSLVLSQ